MVCVVTKNLVSSSSRYYGGAGSTVSIRGKFYHVANADVDDTEEALILLLKLLLVKYLDGQYAILIHAAKGQRQ